MANTELSSKTKRPGETDEEYKARMKQKEKERSDSAKKAKK